MLVQSSHTHSDRGLDPYFTPREAVVALTSIEVLPKQIWEPACGNGAISRVLVELGHNVTSTDIADYGFGQAGMDFLRTSYNLGVVAGIVTNPPFKLAMAFAEHALRLTHYTALLLRTNFLESTSRLSFFRAHPPSRVWVSSRRLPMMHRLGWNGPEAPSNTCHAWFIWDATAERERELNWFDWQDYYQPPTNATPEDLGL